MTDTFVIVGNSDERGIMAKKKILVSGASGATGGSAVASLVASGHEVRALVHEEDSRAASLRALGVEVVTGDLLEVDSIKAALADISAAYFVYPLAPGILTGTVNFAQAAKEAGVEAIVNLSQMTSRRDSKSHAARDHWLAEQVLDWSGVPTTHLRPTLFAEWLLYPFSWDDNSCKETLALPFGKGRFAPIAAEDQGRAIAAILTDPAPHAGKLYKLLGPVEMDLHEMAAVASSVLGRKITYRPIETDEFLAKLQTIHGFESPFLAQHLAAVAIDCRNGITSGTNHSVEDLTGTPPLTIEGFINKHLSAFLPGGAKN